MDQGERTRGTRRRVAITAALVALAAAVAAPVWWFTTSHPAMHLTGGPVGGLVCFDPTASTELVRGGIAFAPPADATILSVRLVNPHNLELVDARVAPVRTAEDGGSTIFGATTGWPIEEPDQYSIDWAGDRELVGARLRPGVSEAPYVHLHVVDPSQSSSTDGWRVEYRMHATRWVSTLDLRTTVPARPATCEDV